MLNKILNSRVLKFCLSGLLIYFAYRKFDLASLFKQLFEVKIWFLVVIILLGYLLSFLSAYRWSLLLITKPKFKDIILFFKSMLAAAFYGIFFPTSVAGDILKWIIINDKYSEIPKVKLLASVLLDRFVGLSTFMFTGSLMLFFARFKGITIPLEIELFVWGLFAVCLLFYIILFFFDTNKLWKIKYLAKFKNLADILKKENLGQIGKSILVALFGQLGWILQMWLISWYFGANLTIMSILIYLPIISIILTLPISFAGFGAREQLYLFFFVNLATSPESILLTSTFSGVLGVVTCLFGGLITLTPDFKKNKVRIKRENK